MQYQEYRNTETGRLCCVTASENFRAEIQGADPIFVEAVKVKQPNEEPPAVVERKEFDRTHETTGRVVHVTALGLDLKLSDGRYVRWKDTTNPSLRICSYLRDFRTRLLSVTDDCADDMTDPGDVGVMCEVRGNHLDNRSRALPSTHGNGEFTVCLGLGNKMEWFNLADLIALARSNIR